MKAAREAAARRDRRSGSGVASCPSLLSGAARAIGDGLPANTAPARGVAGPLRGSPFISAACSTQGLRGNHGFVGAGVAVWTTPRRRTRSRRFSELNASAWAGARQARPCTKPAGGIVSFDGDGRISAALLPPDALRLCRCVAGAARADDLRPRSWSSCTMPRFILLNLVRTSISDSMSRPLCLLRSPTALHTRYSGAKPLEWWRGEGRIPVRLLRLAGTKAWWLSRAPRGSRAVGYRRRCGLAWRWRPPAPQLRAGMRRWTTTQFGYSPYEGEPAVQWPLGPQLD